MKKAGQPIDSASTPASGPTHTRPTDAKALSSAYCVAVKRWLHRLIRKATKAAVPMPPDRFSKAMTISSPPSTGVGCASFTKPQSKAGSTRPGISPLPLTASHQKPRLLAICSTPNSSSERHSPSRASAARRASAPPMVSHRPMILLTTPTSAGLKAMLFSRKGVISEPAKASPSL